MARSCASIFCCTVLAFASSGAATTCSVVGSAIGCWSLGGVVGCAAHVTVLAMPAAATAATMVSLRMVTP